MSDKLKELSQNMDDLLDQLEKLQSKPIDIEFEEVKEEEHTQPQKNTPI